MKIYVMKIITITLLVTPLLERPLHAGKWYQSHFVPASEIASKTLTEGRIVAAGEEPYQMIERVVDTIASAEQAYPELAPQMGQFTTARFAQQLGILMDEGAIIFSTPIMTNAGRFDARPLSACAMPPVNLHASLDKIKRIVDLYHQGGMGTGFNLSETDDPISMLTFLNGIAVEGARGQKEQRPVGNMAILDVNSPAIKQFITIKAGADDRGEDWKFNLSVNVSDDFMQAVEHDKQFILTNGESISATALFEKIAYTAHQCGDPGLISLARLNADNPTPQVAEYKTTAPCAEVGLAPGETCVFGYINLALFVSVGESPVIDFERLQDAVHILTRALDNALEVSIRRYEMPESATIMRAKRKIGIGVCGFADMLIALNISYRQQDARDTLKDVLNFISLNSKQASMELAKYRGSFGAISSSRYMDEAFLLRKYSSTAHVSEGSWEGIAQAVKSSQLLRNATTTSLPPTGRSAMVFGASTGIEPLFSLGVVDQLRARLDQRQLYITATELSPEEHLQMAISAQQAIDESISKTINVPAVSSPSEIAAIYSSAYKSGLKGISVYRDSSRQQQPKPLLRSAILTPKRTFATVLTRRALTLLRILP